MPRPDIYEYENPERKRVLFKVTFTKTYIIGSDWARPAGEAMSKAWKELEEETKRYRIPDYSSPLGDVDVSLADEDARETPLLIDGVETCHGCHKKEGATYVDRYGNEKRVVLQRCALCHNRYCKECFGKHYCGEGDETYRDNPDLPTAPHAFDEE